jgi:CBS domain containing-hemolysin-like protein
MHMPFIRTMTNVNLDEAQEKSLREGTAELIKDILGKDPIRMMTAVFILAGEQVRFIMYPRPLWNASFSEAAVTKYLRSLIRQCMNCTGRRCQLNQ